MMRFFAIGLKGWVQLRVARKPPRVVASEATTLVKHTSYRWVPGVEMNQDGFVLRYGRMVATTKPKKLKMVCTIYEGGRTLATIASAKVRRKLKISILENGLVEISKEQLKELGVVYGRKSKQHTAPEGGGVPDGHLDVPDGRRVPPEILAEQA